MSIGRHEYGALTAILFWTFNRKPHRTVLMSDQLSVNGVGVHGLEAIRTFFLSLLASVRQQNDPYKYLEPLNRRGWVDDDSVGYFFGVPGTSIQLTGSVRKNVNGFTFAADSKQRGVEVEGNGVLSTLYLLLKEVIELEDEEGRVFGTDIRGQLGNKEKVRLSLRGRKLAEYIVEEAMQSEEGAFLNSPLAVPSQI